MDFKLWLERLYQNDVNFYGDEFPIYINPTIEELLTLGKSIRGIAEEDCIFVWSEKHADHRDVAETLGVPLNACFYLFQEPFQQPPVKFSLGVSSFSSPKASLQWLWAHPKIQPLHQFLMPYKPEDDDSPQIPHFHRYYPPPDVTATG